MEQGGDEASSSSSLALEDVLVYLYTNRITILPLAGDDNGMEKRNRTSSGYCHAVQFIVSPTAGLSFPL